MLSLFLAWILTPVLGADLQDCNSEIRGRKITYASEIKVNHSQGKIKLSWEPNTSICAFEDGRYTFVPLMIPQGTFLFEAEIFNIEMEAFGFLQGNVVKVQDGLTLSCDVEHQGRRGYRIQELYFIEDPDVPIKMFFNVSIRDCRYEDGKYHFVTTTMETPEKIPSILPNGKKVETVNTYSQSEVVLLKNEEDIWATTVLENKTLEFEFPKGERFLDVYLKSFQKSIQTESLIQDTGWVFFGLFRMKFK